jgi:Protein of unknown function (DUF3768)
MTKIYLRNDELDADPEAQRQRQASHRIRELNDRMRTTMTGECFITRGINDPDNGEHFLTHVLQAVRTFDNFTENNDPHGEHDMAFIDVDDLRVFFKIDYFDLTGEYGSEDPSNPNLTRRVLTIGLAEEY